MVRERAQPRRGEPADADRGAHRDARGEAEPVRQVLLAHHDGDAEVRDHHEADRDEQDRRGPAADEQERDEQRAQRAHRQHDDRAPPEAVDEPAADVGPHRAGDQHHAQRGVAGRLARAQLDREVDRHEGLEAEEHDGAQPDDRGEARERPPFVAARLHLPAVLDPRRGRARARAGGPSSKTSSPAASHSGISASSVPCRPNASTAGVIEQRAEREARVAAEREHAHALPALPAAGVVGPARPLRDGTPRPRGRSTTTAANVAA